MYLFQKFVNMVASGSGIGQIFFNDQYKSLNFGVFDEMVSNSNSFFGQ